MATHYGLGFLAAMGRYYCFKLLGVTVKMVAGSSRPVAGLHLDVSEPCQMDVVEELGLIPTCFQLEEQWEFDGCACSASRALEVDE